jgi:anti-sigma factor RsiW
MSTHPTDDQLQDLVDGVSAGSADVEQHLATCAECARAVARLRELVAATKSLPRTMEPPRDLYPAIAARVAGRKSATLPRRDQRWLALAAAVALVVVSSAVTALLLRERAAPVVEIQLPARARAIEASYVQAVVDLEQQLAVARAKLSPATVAVVERNLQIIDRAITESREALAHDPGNRHAARLLWTSYQHKLELLQRVTRLGASS